MATGRGFGKTWWGQAWLDALEGIAGGATGRLGRGRTYARQNRAADLRIEPGLVTASVQGSRAEPYETHLVVRPFREDEWDAVIDAIAARAAHAAALLDGELDPGVVDDASAVEVDLLPRPRDLSTSCSCPDFAEPCKHAAALCYLVADALDADPFVLLLLRGRRRDDVLDAVRERRLAAGEPGVGVTGADVTGDGDGEPGSGRSGAEHPGAGEGGAVHGGGELAPDLPGIDAAVAWARELAELPSVPLLANAPSRPAAWPGDPPRHAPFDGDGLRALVADAARRAWELAAGLVDTGLALDARADLARRAASASPTERDRLARASGVAAVDLESIAEAWTHAGAGGVRAHDEARWTPPPLEMARARDLIADAGLVARRVHVSGNRVSAEGRLQFRRSRDGFWYLFTKSSGRWRLAAPPEADLDDLLDHDLHD